MVGFRTSGHIISNWCTIHCIMFARVLELCFNIKDAGCCPNCVSIARKWVFKELVGLKYSLQFSHTSKEMATGGCHFSVCGGMWVYFKHNYGANLCLKSMLWAWVGRYQFHSNLTVYLSQLVTNLWHVYLSHDTLLLSVVDQQMVECILGYRNRWCEMVDLTGPLWALAFSITRRRPLASVGGALYTIPETIQFPHTHRHFLGY